MADYRIWMSYDLGLGLRAEDVSKEEYQKEYQKRSEKLHQWLQKYNALDCGDSAAYIACYVKETGSIDEVIKRELQAKGIGEEENIRIYVVAYNKAISPENSKTNINIIEFAGYLFGERKKAPWEGEEQKQYSNVDVVLS